MYISPAGEFRVNIQPEFGLAIEGVNTAVLVWNTAHPPLVGRMVHAALALLPDMYRDVRALDFAVLSLREPRLYRLSEASDQTLLSARLVAGLDAAFADLRDDLGLPPPRPEDRPPPPG